jgi:GNAT superfamily N-acetyltransferase
METTKATERPVFVHLSGALFDGAIYGARTATERNAPWLSPPTLKYFAPRSPLQRAPDTRELFVCHVGKTIVGLLELQRSPYNAREAWLMYVSVDPLWQRRGIAAELLEQMASWLASQGLELSRSRASDEGAARIQRFIDALLPRYQIVWRQGDRTSS